jgi:hypothetical protein
MAPFPARGFNPPCLIAPFSRSLRQSHLSPHSATEQVGARENAAPGPSVAFADRFSVARVLAFVATARRAVDFEDLRHAPELAEFDDDQLAGALVALVYGDHLECRKVEVRFREGDRSLRRDVPVYYLASRDGGET